MNPISNAIKFASGTLVFAAIFSIALSSCQKITDENTLSSPEKTAKITGNYMPNELLVKFKKGIPEQARMNVLMRINGEVSEKILTKAMERTGDNDGIYLVHTPLNAIEAITKAQGLPEIEFAEPNYIYEHDATSNDPYFINGSLWGMYSNASSPANTYGSRAADAWANGHTGSNEVYVGIIDEGIMYTHADLSGNIWTNPQELANGKDDDGNGYIDDFHGWDFDGNNNTIFDGTQDDHATHVAGTIGARGGNSTGVAGVNWNVTMICAKFLGRRGGTTANAVKAVDYITDLKTRYSLNLPATNNSWGGGGYSAALAAAIGRANTAEILFVAAAGNDGLNIDINASYPACYSNPNIIAVASITSGGGLSGFSNYGATMVDIGAPGSSIYSTVPGNKGASGYASYSGTSMATPHVTGAIALYAATHSGTAADYKNAILSTSLSTSSLSGKCSIGGRLNASSF